MIPVEGGGRRRSTLELMPLTDEDYGEQRTNTAAGNEQEEDDTPLDLRVIRAVKAIGETQQKNTKSTTGTAGMISIRPARLAAELGWSTLSVNDACAELCGLMAAVGPAASFTFEQPTTTSSSNNNKQQQHTFVMVFHFPVDFDRRALSNRRRDDWMQTLQKFGLVVWKATKIVTAFGLILSLLILCIAAIVGMIAALVAMARMNQGQGGGGGGDSRQQQAQLIRHMRGMFYTIRQLLWWYAMFAPGGGADSSSSSSTTAGQDPFLKEIAMDLYLVTSVCCASPTGIFYWMRARQLAQRRNRLFRGWGGVDRSSSSSRNNPQQQQTDPSAAAAAEEEINRNKKSRWAYDYDDDDDPDSAVEGTAAATSEPEHRGLLSVAVEFLFGPTPFDPGPSMAQRWKLRAAVILQLSSLPTSLSRQQQQQQAGSIALKSLAPFVDRPPPVSDREGDTLLLAKEVMLMVVHFNGVPSNSNEPQQDNNNNNKNDSKATTTNISLLDSRFDFPELMAESEDDVHYNNRQFLPNLLHVHAEMIMANSGNWLNVLYCDDDDDEIDNNDSRTMTTTMTNNNNDGAIYGLSEYLVEYSFKLTKLSPAQFRHCAIAGLLNLVGVLWFSQSLSKGGILELSKQQQQSMLLGSLLHRGLIPVLQFYAVLFFAIPLSRLVVIFYLNHRRRTRNERRQALASKLEEEQKQQQQPPQQNSNNDDGSNGLTTTTAKTTKTTTVTL